MRKPTSAERAALQLLAAQPGGTHPNAGARLHTTRRNIVGSGWATWSAAGLAITDAGRAAVGATPAGPGDSSRERAAMRVRWQRAAITVINSALDHAAAAGVELPTWTVGFDGFTAEVSGLANGPEQIRWAFGFWADHFGAEIWPERTTNGVTHLSAHAKNHRGTNVAVRATIIYPDEE